MKFNIRKEIPLLVIVVLPFVYLAYIWNSLPDKVPLHWNITGEIDRWGDKSELITILFLLPVLVYVIFLLVPIIDPKKKIKQMGNKFYHLKFLMIFFMSLIAMFVIYSAQSQTLTNIKVVYALIGFLLVGLGNYLPTVKPNYFIGIRTPWTLENETVWKETHNLAGKLWFFGGAILILIVLLLPAKSSFITFVTGVVLLTIVPIVFSYTKFQALKKSE